MAPKGGAPSRADAVGDAAQLAEELMVAIRALGRVPKQTRGTGAAQTAERNLASSFRRARADGRLTAEHEAELAGMDVEDAPGDDPQLANASIAQLMQDIRSLGRLPKAVQGSGAEQVSLVSRGLPCRHAEVRVRGKLSSWMHTWERSRVLGHAPSHPLTHSVTPSVYHATS